MSSGSADSAAAFETVYPGIWRASFGAPERFSPVKLRFRQPAKEALRRMSAPSNSPIGPAGIRGQKTSHSS
ncbi:MAG: hypothetical protein ACRD2G_04475 [Terriglobia bacterium]